MPGLKTTSSKPATSRQVPPSTVVSRRPLPSRINGNVSIESQSPISSPKSQRATAAEHRSENSSKLPTGMEQSPIRIRVTGPTTKPVDAVSTTDDRNDANEPKVNGLLRSVPVDIGLKSFVDYELTQSLDAIDSLTEDELRRFKRRQQRDAQRKRDSLYQLVPEMPFANEKSDAVVESTLIGCDHHVTYKALPTELVDNENEDLVEQNDQNVQDEMHENKVKNNDCAGGKTRRFRLWFDVSGFEPETVRVKFDDVNSIVEVSATTESGLLWQFRL